MKRILGLIGAGGLALLAVTPAQADVVFATNPRGYEAIASQLITVGTPFRVGATPANITALGFFDYTGAGLKVDHQVGIYDLSHQLLASVTIPAGSGATYHDGTRWVNLATALPLAANTGYMLAATMPTRKDSAWGCVASEVSLNPEFALAGTGYTLAFGSSLAYPDSVYGNTVYLFGANMMASVPEPSQWAAMGLTLLGVAGYGFRRYQLRRTA